MSGEPRRTPPKPPRLGWTEKHLRFGPQTVEALKYQCALTPQFSENQVVGAIIREVHRFAELRLHGPLLEKYHAGEMPYKELQEIGRVFSQVRCELGMGAPMAEVAKLTAERIAERQGEPEDQQAAE